MSDLRHIVAEGMHPWVHYTTESNPLRLKAEMPSMHEILEAADRLIAHLGANGYIIRKID